MSARTIMIQGTASNAGKSIITAGLCRLFRQDGFKVAPFKSQNMSNNSYVTPGGGEIGRAQAMQAEAAGILPSVHMNPILLKPNSESGAQVVIHGRPFKNMEAREYQSQTLDLLPKVQASFDRLKEEFEVIVIEGAGSPAEINLQAHDIANMRIAEMAGAPVILAGDIDRGGVFASLIGTVDLIPAEQRQRIKAFVINKFRGDVSLLSPGIDFLQQRTGIPNLGVLPYLHDLRIPEEDGFSDGRECRNLSIEDTSKILIDVIWLPRISNFTDFAPLDDEPDVALSYLREIPNRLPDVLILPGTKSTMADLEYLRSSGFEDWIRRCIEAGVTVIGICGGYQMLGKRISDPSGIESTQSERQGLGYLPVETIFKPEKVTKQVSGTHLKSGKQVSGYEIHMGDTVLLEDVEPVLEIKGPGTKLDGCSVREGQVWGTYLHGLFDNDEYRHSFLNAFREKKGMPVLKSGLPNGKKDETYDRLADWLRSNINCDLLYKILKENKKA